jgi:hypothetical protein
MIHGAFFHIIESISLVSRNTNHEERGVRICQKQDE